MVSALVAGLWIIKVGSSQILLPIPGNLSLHKSQCTLSVSVTPQMSWNVPGWVTVFSTAQCLHVMQGIRVSTYSQCRILCLHLILQKNGFRTFTSTMTRLSKTMGRYRLTAIVSAVRVTQSHTCTIFSRSMIAFSSDWQPCTTSDS